MNRVEKLRYIANHYGCIPQVQKTIEELNELSLELVKILTKVGDKEAIIDEIADVNIMVEQLKILYDISPIEVSDRIDFKLNRQLERIGYKENDNG